MIFDVFVRVLATIWRMRCLPAPAGFKAPTGAGETHFSELLISLNSPANRFMVVSDRFSGVLVANAEATA